MARVCVDASVIIAWLLPTQRSPQAQRFWNRVLEEELELVAPPLLYAEAASALRLQVFRGELEPPEGDALFADLLALGIRESNPARLKSRAWELAKRFNHPRVYDAHYLALAELEDCDLWTADARLANTLGLERHRVKVVGEDEMESERR